MSTRGAIVRFTNGEITEFAGRYHHWDSYPRSLGATLWKLYHGHFQKDLKAMLQFLIDDHPAGWSTINNKDFALETGYQRLRKGPCSDCDKAYWEHYYQEWESHGRPLTSKARDQMARANYLALGHSYTEMHRITGPECYCHGDRSEDGHLVTHENAADIGCEWVYGFDEGPTLVILSSYCADDGPFAGHKMIGMFGSGDPKATWKEIGRVPLEGPEPDWERVQCGENLERRGHVEGYHERG
jgi:hypothetical protein